MKVRIVALGTRGNVPRFMEMQFLAALIADQRSQADEFAAVVFGICRLQLQSIERYRGLIRRFGKKLPEFALYQCHVKAQPIP